MTRHYSPLLVQHPYSIETGVVTFRLFAVRDGHYSRTEAEGAIFYQDGEPKSLVENDIHAHEGLRVEDMAGALEAVGIIRDKDILLTSTEFIEMREHLAP